MKLSIPSKGNKKLEELISRVSQDVELTALWKASNVMAINRMGYNDHGPTHVKIVSNIALKILRIFTMKGRVPNAVKDFQLTAEDAEVIVVMGALLHDIGHIVHRHNHEEFSVAIAGPLIDRLLHGIYDRETTVIMRGEIMHCMICHTTGIVPQTLEAAVVKIADALDMEQGRARIPFHAGKVDIHSVSAMAIEKVDIKEGTDKILDIEITMSNSAGIFQIDNLLMDRIEESHFNKDVKVIVLVTPHEKRVIDRRIEL